MPVVSHTSARITAIAEKIGDVALSAFERDDGTLVIVFGNKGKLFFEPEEVAEVQTYFEPIIHTKEEAEEAVANLPLKHKRKEKRN